MFMCVSQVGEMDSCTRGVKGSGKIAWTYFDLRTSKEGWVAEENAVRRMIPISIFAGSTV